ncbi:MAG: Ribosomal RNA small subunit methyltransferase H [Chlamydiae bacterium]|nr:Ribosomal RNA small subunit methyltransferase H [Chlamydiota bacterium]
MAHIPAMLKESLEIFKGKKISLFFDGTLGAGGFARALLQEHGEIERYFGCDRDESALNIAREKLKEFEGKVEFVHANFRDVKELLEERGVSSVEGFFLTWECRQCN